MKIKKIEITNFRCIKHIELNVNDMANIITGANNIGKSTVLNAVHWFITNCLLTDKWGVGENDLDSIVPIDFKKGEHTNVTITFEDGSTFTKLLKTKPTGGHYTEYQVNGASGYTAKSFGDVLYSKFNFTPALKSSKDVNELRVLVDPLYPLQKLDPKALRQLLVDLGCSVTNEEVFSMYPEYQPLQKHESKYMGDFTMMRQNLKAERLEANKKLEALETALADYQDIEEYDSTEREALEAKKDDLNVRIRNLKRGDTNLTSTLEAELQKAQANYDLELTEQRAKRNQELALLRKDLQIAQAEANEGKNKLLTKLNEELRGKLASRNSISTTIAAYQSTRDEKRKQVLDLQSRIENSRTRIEVANKAYDEISKREFKGYVTCPKCGMIFPADEGALLLFNKQKQDDLERIKNENARTEIEIVEMQKQFEVNANLGREAKANQEEAEHKLESLNEEIENINNEILAASSKPIDLSKVNEIQTKIDTLNATAIIVDDSNIIEIQNKIDEVIINQAQANAAEIERLETELTPIKEAIEAEYMKQSKYASKLEFEAKYKDTQAKLNDIESLLELVSSFIQTKISLINKKAKELTGIDFVMLEDNISNDGVKEVCYATVDGVEFGNVNTSKKLEVGIQFIHKIREILGANDLPILADRLEGFDDMEKIRNLTTEQLICTVVGDKEQKKIIII